MCIRRVPANRWQKGLTLIELVIAIAVISVTIAGVLQVMTLVTRNSADPQMRKQALAVAEAVLEEVELMPFTDCDPSNFTPGPPSSCTLAESMNAEPGEGRGSYDNVNDYNNLTFNAATNDLNNSGTVTIPAGYSAHVDVATDANLGPTGLIPTALIPAADSLRITVTVTYNNGNNTLVLEGYRTRYDPTAMP